MTIIKDIPKQVFGILFIIIAFAVYAASFGVQEGVVLETGGFHWHHSRFGFALMIVGGAIMVASKNNLVFGAGMLIVIFVFGILMHHLMV